MAQANIYKCKPAKEVIAMTAVLIGIMASMLVYICINTPNPYSAWLAVGLVVTIIIVAYLGTPRAVIVDNDGVAVKLALRGKFIPMESIVAVRRVARREVFLGSAHHGVGGFFSYTGSARNKNLGSFRMFVRNTNEMIFIDCGESGVVLSADSADELIEDILARKSGTTKL